jgi:hypothetical protein
VSQIKIAQSFNADEYSPSRKLYKNLLFTVTQKNKPTVFFKSDTRSSVHLDPKPLLDCLNEVGKKGDAKNTVTIPKPEDPQFFRPGGSPHSR